MSLLLKTAEEIIESVKQERDWYKQMLEKRDAEVERLQAELARYYKISSEDEKYIFDREAHYVWADIYGEAEKNPNESCFTLCVTAEEHDKEIERLRADAERYRWLRSRMDCVDVSRFKNRDDPNPVIDAEVDAAIDAALHKALRESSTLVAKGRLIDGEGK